MHRFISAERGVQDNSYSTSQALCIHFWKQTTWSYNICGLFTWK